MFDGLKELPWRMVPVWYHWFAYAKKPSIQASSDRRRARNAHAIGRIDWYVGSYDTSPAYPASARPDRLVVESQASQEGKETIVMHRPRGVVTRPRPGHSAGVIRHV